MLIGESRKIMFEAEYPFFSFLKKSDMEVVWFFYYWEFGMWLDYFIYNIFKITVPFSSLPPKKSRQNSTDIDFY
jgi:hypothetical protein